MTSDDSSRTQTPRRSGLGKRIAIPGWATILLAFVLSGATISYVWYGAQESFVKPYYECRRKSISLCPVVQDVQVQVEYPRRISEDDRGVQHHKRLVVSVTKIEAGSPELISLAVKPVSGHIHFLTEKGGDRSGHLIVTATHGITEVHTLYIEHPNVPLCGPISLSLQILPPAGAITQPVSVEKSDFAIEEEPFIAGTIRGVVSLMPWQTFLLSFLAIPGALLKTLWDRRKGMADLHEKMKQAWEEWKIDDIRGMYREYQGLILCHIPFFWSTALDIPGHRGIELLHRRAEAHFHYERAFELLHRGAEARSRFEQAQAEEHLARALDWDPTYEEVRLLDERTQKLEEEYQKTKGQTVWWLEPMPDKVGQMLIKLLEDREKAQTEVRKRIVNVLGHIGTLEARMAVEKALLEDNDLFVQSQAAWMLARRPRPEQAEERKLRIARTGVVEKWLKEFPSPLEYDPFEAITAEADRFLGRHFFGHPAYRQLLDHSSQSIAIFADPGGGKTSCRRMFKSSLKSPPNLVVEYTDFSALVREAGKVSVEDHVQGILQQASALLGFEAESLTPSDVPWREQLKHFLESAQEKGYMTVHVLVDNVDGYTETQANLRIAELFIRHLVGNFDLLDTTNLYFKLFLPMSLKERLLKYGGFVTDRIRITDMEWTENLLQEMLRARLEAASLPRRDRGKIERQGDSLSPFVTDDLSDRPRDNIDRLLIQSAQASPRRLITLADKLFQHRAQTWYESGKKTEELYIRIADLATLLEYLSTSA